MTWARTMSGLIVPERYGDFEDYDEDDFFDGPECIKCGCSQNDACYEGEPWAQLNPPLCQSCAMEEAA